MHPAWIIVKLILDSSLTYAVWSLTHSTRQSTRIDLSRSAYSKAFNILLIELDISYLEQMFPKLSRISG